MKTVAIHLGVHKTASTYLQQTICSDMNRGVLAKYRLRMLPPRELREIGFTNLFRRTANSEEPVEPAVRKLAKIAAPFLEERGTDRVIFSEENLVGLCTELFSTGKLYPTFEKRLDLLQSIFPIENLEIFICLRPFSTYLPSAYCESLRGLEKSFSFNRYIKGLDPTDFTWIPMLKKIREKLPKAKLTIWRFERLRDEGYLNVVMNALLGCNISSEIAPKEDKVRTSIPSNGIRLINSARSLLSDKEIGDLIKLLDSPKMQWDVRKSYEPWTKIEQKYLADQHSNDLDFIRNNSDQFRLL